MNNKEFIAALSQTAGLTAKETQGYVNAFLDDISDTLYDNTSFNVTGFGSLEVKKKMERITVNPQTKRRKLLPPKLSLAFKPSVTLKDKVK